jgi:hypothetical protein
MPPDQALGRLIFMLNPYTNGSSNSIAIGPGGPGDNVDLGQVSIEVDNYSGQWSFKGQEQRVAKAIRIQYRYRADDEAGNNGVLTTEHLLIGFVGSGGGE